MKRLLMATDLSARSDRALERAVRLAADHGAELTIAHVVDEDLPSSISDVQEKEAKQAIQEHIGSLTAGNGPHISIKVVLGRDYVDILEMSEKIRSRHDHPWHAS